MPGVFAIGPPARERLHFRPAPCVQALRAGGGWLALHDKSPPEQIRAELRMSKKAFKRALGGLYKARRVALEEGGAAAGASAVAHGTLSSEAVWSSPARTCAASSRNCVDSLTAFS